jgi:hypothetical protein
MEEKLVDIQAAGCGGETERTGGMARRRSGQAPSRISYSWQPSWGSVLVTSGSRICDRNASYRAKKAASTSPGLCHWGSARRGLSPNSQALARVYKTFASSTSSGTIAARGSRTRRFRAHSAVCLIKTSKSGKRRPSRPPIDAVAIASPPDTKKALVPAPARISASPPPPSKNTRRRTTRLSGWLTRPPGRVVLHSPEAPSYEKTETDICPHRYTFAFCSGSWPAVARRGVERVVSRTPQSGMAKPRNRDDARPLKIVSECREPSRRVYYGAA